MNCFKSMKGKLAAVMCAAVMALAVLGIAPKAAFAEGETYTIWVENDGESHQWMTDYTLDTEIELENSDRLAEILNNFTSVYHVGTVHYCYPSSDPDESFYTDNGDFWHAPNVIAFHSAGSMKARFACSIYGAIWNFDVNDVKVSVVLNTADVRFDANGGSGHMDNQVMPTNVPTPLNLNEYTWDDHKFLWWTDDAEGEGMRYRDGGNITIKMPKRIYAQWAAKHKVTVTDDGNGTASADTDKAYLDDEVSLSVDSANEGYTFDEWEVVSGGVTISDDKFTMPDEDVEIKAKFSPISYTVAYDANGGDGQMSDFTLSWGDEQALDACTFTREGYTFAGWKDGDGNTYEDGATVKNLTNVDGSTVTLRAQWTPNSYTVSYDANGGSGTMADQAFTYDAEQALTSNAFTREGYTFAGWQGSDGNFYSDGESVKNLTSTDGAVVTMTAQWDAIMCTVTFNANGGSGQMDPQTMQYGVPTALNANRFSRDGYTFVCWNTAADGSGTKVADGINLKVTGDVTLYAQWKKDPVKKAEAKKVETSGTGAKKNAALPKTGDPAPVAATVAAAIAGIAALAAGVRTRRK